MEKHLDYAMFYYYYRITTIREQIPRAIKILVHKMDGPNKGQTYANPQSGWTPRRLTT